MHLSDECRVYCSNQAGCGSDAGRIRRETNTRPSCRAPQQMPGRTSFAPSSRAIWALQMVTTMAGSQAPPPEGQISGDFSCTLRCQASLQRTTCLCRVCFRGRRTQLLKLCCNRLMLLGKFAVHKCVCAACCTLSSVQFASVLMHCKTRASWLLASGTCMLGRASLVACLLWRLQLWSWTRFCG